MVNAVSVNNVSKQYGKLTALNNVSLQIEQGEFFGLLGPNGAGKSTLISLLAGLIKPTQGTLSVLGHDVQADFRQSRIALGVVPQEIAIDPFFTVEEALKFQSGYYGIRGNQEWIDELLNELNLADKRGTNLRKLSGGMKRRLLIALALVQKPQVLVLDEPTAGVDVELRHSLWRFIKRLHRQGMTMILTTHYLEEAEELCDRIAIIDRGQVIALEDKQTLLAKGLGTKVVVHTQEPLSVVPEQLRASVIAQEGNKLELIYHREQASINQIVNALTADGAVITDFSTEADSLEDVFVRLTTESVEIAGEAS